MLSFAPLRLCAKMIMDSTYPVSKGENTTQMDKRLEDMSIDELKAELKRLKDSLCDIEDLHSFTFGKTSVHIGAEQAQNMTAEYEEECKVHNEQIEAVEKVLKAKGAV
jgi:hypothetical protein